jgi:hypothetical protein
VCARLGGGPKPEAFVRDLTEIVLFGVVPRD